MAERVVVREVVGDEKKALLLALCGENPDFSAGSENFNAPDWVHKVVRWDFDAPRLGIGDARSRALFLKNRVLAAFIAENLVGFVSFSETVPKRIDWVSIRKHEWKTEISKVLLGESARWE